MTRLQDSAARVPRSALPEVVWPAVPAPVGASLLALHYQLRQSERWSPASLRRWQFRQLRELLLHAAATLPFWAERLRAARLDPSAEPTADAFARLPLLTRREIQDAGAALVATRYPPEHGRTLQFQSSGSTGEPIRSVGTETSHFFNGALTLRNHLWHRHDFSLKVASIRTTVESGSRGGWGIAIEAAFPTGEAAGLNISTPVDEQLEWLQREQPAYLVSHPSNVLALAERSLALGVRLPALRNVITFGESLPAGLRATCHAAWGAGVKDMYSAEEMGYMALQCPDHEHYHVQSENVLLEVLRDDGTPCEPGEIGRVVVTPLHNFAMPLLRYANGDHAEVGPPCPCGRGLPVLSRIMGRGRNMLRLPDGSSHWPSFPSETWIDIAPIRRLQLVQHTLTAIEARIVADRDLGADETARLAAALRETLGHPFDVSVSRVDAIGRGGNFKFEDFICRVPP